VLYTWSGFEKEKMLNDFVNLINRENDEVITPAKKILRAVLLLLMGTRQVKKLIFD
jgi:hypothetical protein